MQSSKLPSTSYHGSDFIKEFNVDVCVENEICVVDPCHKQDDIMCHPLKGYTLDVMDEPHVVGKHEEDAYLRVLAKNHEEKYIYQ